MSISAVDSDIVSFNVAFGSLVLLSHVISVIYCFCFVINYCAAIFRPNPGWNSLCFSAVTLINFVILILLLRSCFTVFDTSIIVAINCFVFFLICCAAVFSHISGCKFWLSFVED